jgi:hypothetical protein
MNMAMCTKVIVLLEFVASDPVVLNLEGQTAQSTFHMAGRGTLGIS